MKKKYLNTKLFFILLCELVGIIAGLLTRDGIILYSQTLIKPPLSPPAIWFPVVWTILYALMGIGAARIYLAHDSRERSRSLFFFVLQLAANFLWSIIFFRSEALGFAFLWLIFLWILIVAMNQSYRKVDKLAAKLQIPYLIWVTFAGYLNLGVYLLNR